jgi:AraC-like DNA-binding protein
MDVVLGTTPDPHRSLVDMQMLGTVDPLAFREMADYVASRWQGFSETIVKQALLRPSGFSGAVVAGFYAVVKPAYPVRIFDEVAPALEWLGIPQDSSFRTAVMETRVAMQATEPLVAQLRAALSESNASSSLVELARRLGVSPRTLQRKLQQAGTTVHAEVSTARLAQAQKLMLTSGLNLTAIALELGFKSLQHFSSRFRQQHGESPSAWLRSRTEPAADPTLASSV